VIIRKYWDIPLYPRAEQFDLAPREICRRVLELLADAVRIRLRADVPVGCYLSGGLDSSGTTALVVRNFNKNVRTFGIRFDSAGYDEGVYQSLMVRHLNVNPPILKRRMSKSELHLRTAYGTVKSRFKDRTGSIFLLSDVVRKAVIKL
jgi:asparagine synthase (glutamine-hydrolysing)